jgi:hypothetical protein
VIHILLGSFIVSITHEVILTGYTFLMPVLLTVKCLFAAKLLERYNNIGLAYLY